jgi:hypothetical protein
MTLESYMFLDLRMYCMETSQASPSSVLSASELYKRGGNTHGENTSCRTSELTFAYPQTVMRDCLKIKLHGKHTMLNVTNVNGVATNAEADLLPQPKACSTICIRHTR